MVKTRFSSIVRPIFLLGLLMSVFGPHESFAFDQLMAQSARVPRNYIITIQGEFDEDRAVTWLSPRQLLAGIRDNVTLINESKQEVRIRFGKNAPCREVSVKTLGWNLEPQKCYETRDSLKSKGTVTIRFTNVGTYYYEVEFINKARREQGMIRVQTEER